MEDQPFDIRPYLEMLKRQRWLVLGVFALVFALAFGVASIWPAMYRSTATILVEEQQIPEDLVRSTITTFADQRIQVISQRALTRSNLAELAERYGLYPKRRPYETGEEIIDRMRRNIRIDTVTANAGRTGNRATIAFKVSFEYEDPGAAQKVVSELTTLYLNENVKARQRTTAETSTFLQEEARRLSLRVTEIELQIEAFKNRNAGRLPEQVHLNAQMFERTQLEIERLSRELTSLADRRSFIEAQLASVVAAPTPVAAAAAEVVNSTAERLRVARVQLAVSSGMYRDTHPDVVRLRQEIAGLERLVDPVDNAKETLKQLDEARIGLARATERYSKEHPDVIELRRRVAALERSAAAAGAAAEAEKPTTAPSKAVAPEPVRTPFQFNMQVQLESTSSQMRALEAERADLRRRLVEYEERVTVAPSIEREYIMLTRDHANSLAKYRELQSKLLEAEIAQELERDRKAERFSLIEPAQLPAGPISPNRPAILLVGFLLALGSGLGLGVLREMLDPSIRSLLDADMISAVPVLAAIPVLRSSAQVASRRARLQYLAVAAVAALVGLALLVHMSVMPLNILWLMMLRRLESLPGFFV